MLAPVIILPATLVLFVSCTIYPEWLVVFEHFMLQGRTLTFLALQVIAVKHTVSIK